MQYYAFTDLGINAEPSALSIIHKWRAQKQQDEEQIVLQDKVMNAEHHFRAMYATGEVMDQNAVAFWRRIKNARTELVSFSTFNYRCVNV
jgi:hypothetical protein